MMFKKIGGVKEVQDFVYYKDEFFYIKKGGGILKYDIKSSRILKREENFNKVYKIYGFGQNLFGLDFAHNGFIYSNNLSKVETLSKDVSFILGDKNKSLLVAENMKSNLIGAFSVIEKVFKWSRKDIKSLEQIEENFIGQWQFVLTKYSRDTGEIEWVHDFSDAYPQLKNQNGYVRPIGLAKDILVLGIDKIDRIFGMDIRSGKIIWEVKTLALGLKIGQEGELVHQMMVNYNCFDVLTGKKEKSFVDSDYFEKEIGIETQRDNYVIIGDYIVTTDSRKGKIGAFNTNTGRFDWVHEVEGVSFPAGRDMVYSAPYLFVYDFDSNLHVFEKVD